MTQGIVLLSHDGFYLGNDNQLPNRPSWDKEFITMLIAGKRVLCSNATLKSLPKSMLDIAYFTTSPVADYDINFGIDTFKTAKPDQLIVVRSKYNLNEGKAFNLDGWKLTYKSKDLEIYV